MASLNQIGTFICYRTGNSDSAAIYEQVKMLAKGILAREVRRSLERARYDLQLLQRFHTRLVKVDKADSCFISIDCPIVRSENKIPKPVRLKSDAAFIYVGELGGNKSYTPTLFEEYRYTLSNRFTSKVVRYAYINDYLYFFNALRIKYVEIASIFDDPEQLITFCENADCYSDDMEFPVTNDLLHIIIREILTVEFKMPAIPDNEIEFN